MSSSTECICKLNLMWLIVKYVAVITLTYYSSQLTILQLVQHIAVIISCIFLQILISLLQCMYNFCVVILHDFGELYQYKK